MSFSAVVFDKDGVLVDSEIAKADSWQRTLQQYGVTVGFEWYLKNLGPADHALALLAINTFELVDVNHVSLASQWRTNYAALEPYTSPIASNVRILVRLSTQYPIAVASSMDRRSISADLKRFNLLRYISAYVSGEEAKNNKPAPDVYLAAAKAINVNPTHCIAVEDSTTGVAAAKAAGMFCVGYKNPLYSMDLTKADVVAEDLESVKMFCLS